ncbi:MAG: hypothetical protein WDZ45_01520 [Flavobacteriaceae bacterium]
MKKYIVLGVLFILPITAYLFFSSGVNHFAKLPVLTEDINEFTNFTSLDGKPLSIDGKITILSFFGSDIKSKYGNVFNLTHKIYKPYHEFEDLQFVTVLQKGNEPLVEELLVELNKLTNAEKWIFVYAEAEDIQSLFSSLETDLELDENLGASEVFIIDKSRNLRGRNDDKDVGFLYGYDTSSVAELNNKMNDDVKVILAEYRMALKKYNKRQI